MIISLDTSPTFPFISIGAKPLDLAGSQLAVSGAVRVNYRLRRAFSCLSATDLRFLD
jgi:hypothetical protein